MIRPRLSSAKEVSHDPPAFSQDPHRPFEHFRCQAEIRLDETGSRSIRGALTLTVLLALALIARPAQTQTETVLYNFCSNGSNCTDGTTPTSSLTSDGAGNFYGTTYMGDLEV